MSDELAWLRWWATAWLQTHSDWTPAALAGLGRERLASLARSRHVALGQLYGIVPCAAPKPRPALLELVLADHRRRELTFTLIAALCTPQQDFALSAPQRAWCLSVAKALRPGQWLADGQDSLALLRAWAGAAAWQRLRLGFARARIDTLERAPLPDAPPAKLDALWQAALWRSGQDLPAEAPNTEILDDARPAFA